MPDGTPISCSIWSVTKTGPCRSSSPGSAALNSEALSKRAECANPAPRAIIRSSHYYRTNELSHWVYRERVANVGGVMSGVGSDQLYLLAGWARPEILVPLDFDGEITATHRVVAAVFLANDTPAQLATLLTEDLARWSKIVRESGATID